MGGGQDFQNAWENAAGEAARNEDWPGYNEFMKQAAESERQYMEKMYGTKPSSKDLPATTTPLPKR